jgi:hypothetical protein
MSHFGKKSLLISAALVAIMAGSATAQSSAIEEGPLLAQDSNRVGNYQYMRDRRRGDDPRYQTPGTVYREEYKVDRSAPVYPAGSNDPRFKNGNNPNYDNPYLDPQYRNAYRYDPRAHVNRRYDVNGNPIQPIYDANGNIVGYPNQPYYDANGTLVNNPGRPTYDSNGNIVGYPNQPYVDVNGNPIATPGQPTYDSNGNIIYPTNRPRPTVNQRTQPTYDANGNPQDRAMQVGPFRIRY